MGEGQQKSRMGVEGGGEALQCGQLGRGKNTWHWREVSRGSLCVGAPGDWGVSGSLPICLVVRGFPCFASYRGAVPGDAPDRLLAGRGSSGTQPVNLLTGMALNLVRFPNSSTSPSTRATANRVACSNCAATRKAAILELQGTQTRGATR